MPLHFLLPSFNLITNDLSSPLVFPPFWLFGVLILLSPLTAPADFHPSKPESERQELVQLMRRAEVRWAKRCLWALLGLLSVVAIIVGLVVGTLKGKVGM